MAPDVFISYAHATAQEPARLLRDNLSAAGIGVFLDEREIPYGSPFPRDIADGLLNSRLAVVFADESYFRRPWCIYEFQVITAPYRSADGPEDSGLDHVAIVLPAFGDISSIVAHLPPPLARVSWPAAASSEAIAAMVRSRLATLLPETLGERIESVNDDAVKRLRAGGDIPWAWASAPNPEQPSSVPGIRREYLELAPESRGEEFIGRGAELWRVVHALVTCRAFGTPRSCAVQGLGGSGKSQLAAEFVARYGARFFPQGIVWIDAAGAVQALSSQLRAVLRDVSPASLSAVSGIADAEDERDMLAAALAAHFAALPSKSDWLWIVDGVPEGVPGKSRKIRYWCPPLDSVNVLATSRGTGLELMDAHVELRGLAEENAVELLTRPPVDSRWLAGGEWKDLAAWVGALPLAISILRAGLSDGFTTAEALKLARRKEPSALLDREMDALRGEIEDDRLRGIAEAFDFSYRGLDAIPGLRHAAHLLSRLAPYPLREKLLSELIPGELTGRLARRSWIQSSAAAAHSRLTRRWSMHAIPASFLRGRSTTAADEYIDLVSWLRRVTISDLDENDMHAIEQHFMVLRRGILAFAASEDPGAAAVAAAARDFGAAAVAHFMTAPARKSAGFRFLAAGLANELGAGGMVAGNLADAYRHGDDEVAAAIPHTLGALAGVPQAVELMAVLLSDPRNEVRYQAIVHASGLRSLDLARPVLDALVQEPSSGLVPAYDSYLDNRDPLLPDILSELERLLREGTPRERERAAQLAGRALIVNGKELAAGPYDSRGLIRTLLLAASGEESDAVASAAVASASLYFDAEGYGILAARLAEAADPGARARAVQHLGAYLSGTRRPPPPRAVELEWLDTGGIRISGQLGRSEPLPEGAYYPLVEAAASDDPPTSAGAARAVLATSEGKVAASEVVYRFLDSRAYEPAAAISRALADEEPEFTNAHWWRGQAREALGDWEGGIVDYSTVIRQAPAFADAYLHRGRLLFQHRQFEHALPDLLRAAELTPDAFVAHHLCSLSFYNLGRYDEAEAAASRAIALGPGVGEAWFFRSIARYAAGRFPEAMADVLKSLELNPSDERAAAFKAQLEEESRA